MSAHPSEMSWVGTGSQSSLIDLAINRLGTWMGGDNYTTVNMNKARMYTPVSDVTMVITSYSPYGNDLNTPLPDKIARGVRPPFSEMTSPEALARYTPSAIGDVFGPSWSTHWFRFALSIPKSAFPSLHLSPGGGLDLAADPGRASGLTAAVEDTDELHFIFDCECEGLIWINKAPRQGFTGGNGFDRRAAFTLHPADAVRDTGGRLDFEFFIEIGCNGMFGNADGDNIRPPNPLRRYVLRTAEVRRLDAQYHRLYWHLATVAGVAGELKDDTAGRQALRAATEAANAVVPGDRNTYARGIDILEAFLSSSGYKGSPLGHLHNNPAAARAVARRTGCEAAADAAGLLPAVPEAAVAAAAEIIGDPVGIPGSVQRITAVGHCHIDTAWLWPYAETRRKVVRSWATQLELTKRYPHHKFALSTAQQMEWLRQDCPSLFTRVQKAVAAGQFFPVGGTWVEQDANVPGSEGMVRQFLYGQRFFAQHFGARSRLFWLPDTFGYCAQLPQILRGVGMEYFLTQKLSWNLINPFPYHTFLWKGIDGSSVLAHFPPTDTYTAALSVGEVAKHQRQYRERAITTESILLFGNGDGGGGPQAEMIERLDRLDCAPGMPALTYGSPEALYDRLAAHAPSLPRYDGELYLELHRGTYTTQAAIKLGNATLQQLLHDAEALGALAATLKRAQQGSARGASGCGASEWYPRDVLDQAWHSTLLNHFHDVLPGSCIKLIVDDALELYDAAAAEVAPVVARAAVAVAEAAGATLVPRPRSASVESHEGESGVRAGAGAGAGKGEAGGVCFINTLPFARTEVVELPETFFATSHSAVARDSSHSEEAGGGSDEKGLQYPDSVFVPAKGDASKGYLVAFPRQGPTTGSFTGSGSSPSCSMGSSSLSEGGRRDGSKKSRLVRVTVPGMGVITVAAPASVPAAAAAEAAEETGAHSGVVVYRDRVTYAIPAPRSKETKGGMSKGRLPVSMIPTVTTAAAVRASSLRYRCALPQSLAHGHSHHSAARAHSRPPIAATAAAAGAAAGAGTQGGVVLVSEDVIVMESELARYEVSSKSGRVIRAFDKRPAATAPSSTTSAAAVGSAEGEVAAVGSPQWQGASEWRLIFTPATDTSVRENNAFSQQVIYRSYAEAEAAAAAGAGTGAGHVAAAAVWAAEDSLPLAALGLTQASLLSPGTTCPRISAAATATATAATAATATATAPMTPRRTVACELVSGAEAGAGAGAGAAGSPATSWALTGSATPSPIASEAVVAAATTTAAATAAPDRVPEVTSTALACGNNGNRSGRMRGPSAAAATLAALARAPPTSTASLSQLPQAGAVSGADSVSIDDGDDSYGGAALWVYSDVPLYWDGWDIELYHRQTRRLLTAAAPGGKVQVLAKGGLKGVVEVIVPFQHPHVHNNTRSCSQADAAGPQPQLLTPGRVSVHAQDPAPPAASLRLRLSLVAGSAQLTLDAAADWRAAAHEALKVEFPFHLRSPSAEFEIQYGWASRPAHTNTAVDLAKFEVCAQRWGAVSEGSYTAALLTRAKHGFACRQGTMAVTLLRSPTRPDDECDRHLHRIALAVAPFCSGVAESGVTRHAQAFCAPLVAIAAQLPAKAVGHAHTTTATVANAAATGGSARARSFLGSSRRGVLIEALKLAEPSLAGFPHRASARAAGSEADVILRAYDAEGTAGVGTVWVDAALFPEHPPRCVRCNLLEEAAAGGEMEVQGPRPLTAEEAAQAGVGEGEGKVYAVRLPMRAFEITTLRFTSDPAFE